MLWLTKRQQQVSKLPRKKGHFVSQEILSREAAIMSEVTADMQEWEVEELSEFEVVGKRFIDKALHWHKGAGGSLRSVYTGTSRMTIW